MSVRVQTPPIIRRITSLIVSARTRAAELSVRYCNGIASHDRPSRSPSRSRPAASAIVRATTVACRTCHAVPPKQRIGPRRTLQRLHAEHVTQCLPNDELDHGVRPEPEPLGRKALGSAEGRDYDEIACNQRQSEEAIRRQLTTLTWKRQSRGNQEAVKRQSGGN